MTSITLVVLPADEGELTEEGTRAIFAATLDQSQVNVASAAESDPSAQQSADKMLVNKLLFCACSVVCELATTGVSADRGRFGGFRLTRTAQNPSVARRVSNDTIICAEDNSRILFQLPMECGKFLLALQVPRELFAAFGVSLINIFVQVLCGQEVSPSKLFAEAELAAASGNSSNSTLSNDSSASGDIGQRSSSSFAFFAAAIQSEKGVSSLHRRVQSLMRALLLSVLARTTSATEDSFLGEKNVLSCIARQTGVLPQNAATALAVIHPVLCESISGLVGGTTPIACSLHRNAGTPSPSHACRFVEQGVAVWEQGQLLYYTGTRESLLTSCIPCTLLSHMSVGKHRSMSLFRLPAPRCTLTRPRAATFSPNSCGNRKSSRQLHLVHPQGYVIPPDISCGGEIVSDSRFCLVGMYRNLTVALLLVPSTTPYNGASLEVINTGLVSFLTSASTGTLTLDSAQRGGAVPLLATGQDETSAPCFSVRQLVQWPYLLRDLLQDLSLPKSHPLSSCFLQLQATWGLRAIYVSSRPASSPAAAALCVASPPVNQAPTALLQWVTSTACRGHQSAPVFLSVARKRQDTTEIFSTFVLSGSCALSSGRKRLGDRLLHMALEVSSCQATTAQMRGLTRFVASKSW
jgi:hypothetical protein